MHAAVPRKLTTYWPPRHWLLLRGLGREARHWGGFPDLLARRLASQVHAVDLPGMGARAHRRAPCSVRTTARELARSLDPREVENGFGVVAISLGAMVALALAAELPWRVQALVLINTSSRLSPWSERLTPAGFMALFRSALTKGPIARETLIHELTTNAASDRVAAWARQAATIALEHPVSRRALLRQLCAAARFAPRRVTQPTLILSSRRDRLVCSSCSQALASYLAAFHAEHPSAGHDLPLEDPDWVVEQIHAWLDKTSR